MRSSASTSDKLKWRIVLPLCFVEELFLRMDHLEHPAVKSLLALSDALQLTLVQFLEARPSPSLPGKWLPKTNSLLGQ